MSRLAPLRGDGADAAITLLTEAVDELVDNGALEATTWQRLERVLRTEQIMDLVFTVGGYTLLAMAVRSFGVHNEENT
ncbi:hypothetical protein [Nocardia callitridis]|uniref:Carboxymuconolactone decarboxylase family protein n=1 Tax=Nocardia callitridis TaxID=648753 RepID=A0ABP9KLD1_9NOCA